MRNSGAVTNTTTNTSLMMESVSRKSSCSWRAFSMYVSDSPSRKFVTSNPESNTESRSSRNCSRLAEGVRFRASRSGVNRSLPNSSISRTVMSNSSETDPYTSSASAISRMISNVFIPP